MGPLLRRFHLDRNPLERRPGGDEVEGGGVGNGTRGASFRGRLGAGEFRLNAELHHVEGWRSGLGVYAE